jgi:hypothetical protein
MSGYNDRDHMDVSRANADLEALREEPEEDAPLGPCGCYDYHMADCDLMTSRFDSYEPEPDRDEYDW